MEVSRVGDKSFNPETIGIPLCVNRRIKKWSELIGNYKEL
jgi:hypothetical protein